MLALRRSVAALLLIGFIGLGLWLGREALGNDEEAAPPPPTTTAVVPKPVILRIVFPEGLHAQGHGPAGR